MAEESSQEKTEEPTARKIQKSREEGQVPRSKELSTTVVLVVGATGLLLFSDWIVEHVLELTRFNFTLEREAVFDISQISIHLLASVEKAGYAIMPWMLIVLVGAFVGPLGVGGWNFASKAFMPKLSKLNPLSGIKRMFSTNSLVELLKSWAKVLVVGLVAYLTLSHFFDSAMALQYKPLRPATAEALSIILWTVFMLCASTLIIAMADVPWQIYSNTKKLRMTKQEVKDEYKDTEGKPEVKSKIRQLQREMAQRRMMDDVAEADVVITNPTHYSVALKYDGDSADAPVLVAKGHDQLALKIREIAKQNNVPQMQAPPLARALYTHAKVGAEIPEGLYQAVAQVLAYIFQMDNYIKGQGAKPDRNFDMPIPPDLRVNPDV